MAIPEGCRHRFLKECRPATTGAGYNQKEMEKKEIEQTGTQVAIWVLLAIVR
jgi:hypothetical protein